MLVYECIEDNMNAIYCTDQFSKDRAKEIAERVFDIQVKLGEYVDIGNGEYVDKPTWLKGQAKICYEMAFGEADDNKHREYIRMGREFERKADEHDFSNEFWSLTQAVDEELGEDKELGKNNH